MLLTLSIIGVFLSILIIYFNSRKYPETIYLGLFFLLISLYGLHQYAILYSKSVILISILYIHITYLSYITGPAVYWYVRSVLSGHPGLKKSDVWHFLPMVIFFISSVPYFLLPWQDKVEIAAGIVQDANYLKIVKPTFLYNIFPLNVIYLSRPILILAYTLCSAGLLAKAYRKREEWRILYGRRFMVLWLISLLSLILILAASHTVLLFKTFISHDLVWFYTLNLLQIVSVIGLFALLALPFLFPAVLYGIPVYKRSLTLSSTQDARVFNPESIEKHKNSRNYGPAYLNLIGDKIDNCMVESQPYLKHDFNLAQLSFMTRVPVHHLNFYFRELKKESFCDYRNGFRISYAKKLLLEGKANELTMETIGFLSGFSNRNTFLNAFKKVEGIAPSNFVMKKRPENSD